MRITAKTLQEFLPRDYYCLHCVDGFTMMATGSPLHRCRPRNDHGPWSHVEVGYPSERHSELMLYAKDRQNPTTTVYFDVPITVVVDIVNQHGGLDVNQTRGTIP